MHTISEPNQKQLIDKIRKFLCPYSAGTAVHLPSALRKCLDVTKLVAAALRSGLW